MTEELVNDEPDEQPQAEVVPDTTIESGEPGENPDGQRFAMGLTPFGHIGINVTDSNGQTAGYLITNPEDGSRIIVHLQALVTMMIQSMYAQAMEQERLARELISGNGSGLWTPPA